MRTGCALGEDWRRIGGGSEEDWRRVGGGSEEDWRRWMWTDRCGGAYGVLRGFSLGGFAPQIPHQGGSASLDPPKYGLVTPPLWELRADLFKKRPKS